MWHNINGYVMLEKNEHNDISAFFIESSNTSSSPSLKGQFFKCLAHFECFKSSNLPPDNSQLQNLQYGFSLSFGDLITCQVIVDV